MTATSGMGTSEVAAMHQPRATAHGGYSCLLYVGVL